MIEGFRKVKTMLNNHNLRKAKMRRQVIDPTFILLDQGLQRRPDKHPMQEPARKKHIRQPEVRQHDGLTGHRSDHHGDTKAILEACLIFFRLPDPDRYVFDDAIKCGVNFGCWLS